MSFDGVVNRSAANAPAKSFLRIAAFTEGRSGVSITSSAGRLNSRSAFSSASTSLLASATLSPAM